MKIRKNVAATVAALTLSLAVPAGAQAFWGAIAIDPIAHKAGFSHRQPNPRKALTVAIDDCGSSGCELGVLVLDDYGAVVLKRNGSYFSGTGLTRALAISNARKQARESSARLVAWVFAG
jgi:hypothetical protein